jgi:hypothetical protein
MPVDEQLAALVVPVAQVSPQRRAQVEVTEHAAGRVSVLAQRAGDRLLDADLELLLELLHDLVDHLAGQDPRLRGQQVLVGQQGLDQLDVRLDALEQVRLIEELGDAASSGSSPAPAPPAPASGTAR